jgi:hypothetical protein
LDTINDTTVNMALAGAFGQIGRCLTRIIQAFIVAKEDEKNSWQSGTSRTDSGKQIARRAKNGTLPTSLYNPQGKHTQLVVPTSLQ